MSFILLCPIINVVTVLNDKNIRISLISYIKNYYELDPRQDIIASELALLREGARADVVLVNGIYHCFEIKSELDTLSRLENQLVAYKKYFDMVTVVCTSTHLPKIIENYSQDVGILLAEYSGDSITFSEIRECTRFIGDQYKSRAEFLWKGELVAALVDKGFNDRVKYKNKKFLRETILDTYTKPELDSYIKSSMRQRSNWRAVEVLV